MSLSTLVYCCHLTPDSSTPSTIAASPTPRDSPMPPQSKEEKIAEIEREQARIRDEIARKRAERSTLQAVLDSLPKKEMNGVGGKEAKKV